MSKHSCSDPEFPDLEPWLFCPLLRLSLFYSEGHSYGTEYGEPTELKSYATRTADFWSRQTDLREELVNTFCRSSTNATLTKRFLKRFTMKLSDTEKEVNKLILEVLEWKKQ